MELLHLPASAAKHVESCATFGDRVVAKVIDLVLLGICFFPIDLVLGTSFVNDLHRTKIEGVIAFAFFCLYAAMLESSKQQATWGKRAVGILVSDLDGNRISFAHALLRSIMQYTWAGCFLAAFTRRRQGFHDLVAGTVVTPGTL